MIQQALKRLVSILIDLFEPIWKSEVDICYGFGKDGDDPETRANQRSPWGTLHPGCDWAYRDPKMKDSTEEILRRFLAEMRTAAKHPEDQSRLVPFQLFGPKGRVSDALYLRPPEPRPGVFLPSAPLAAISWSGTRPWPMRCVKRKTPR